MAAVRTSRRLGPRRPPVPPTTTLVALLGVLLALAAGPAVAVAGGAPGADHDASRAPVGPGDRPSVANGGRAATPNVTVYRARNGSFEDAGGVEAAIANGSLERAEELVVGDTLVVAIGSPRLAEMMATGEGSTTERFLGALDGGAEFRLVQTNPTPMKNRKVASVGPGNVTAYRKGATTYVLVDTGDLEFRYWAVNRSTRIYGGERFAVRFGHDLAELPRGEDPAAPVVRFHPFRAELDASGYWYDPLPPEWVRLSADVGVEPDESLVARVWLENGRTIAAPVEPDDVPGLNGVWLDLRGVEPGTGYALELVFDGEVVDRYNGTVREPRATLSGVEIVQFEGGAAVNATVSATHGGRIEVLGESCDVLGSKWIEPGIDRRVTVELWSDGYRMQVRPDVLVRVTRHHRASGALYRGAAGWTTADYEGGYCPPEGRPPTPTPTPAPTATATPTPNATPTPTVSPTATPTPPTTPATEAGSPASGEPQRTSGDGGSGFTLATTLLGLVAVVLLRARYG